MLNAKRLKSQDTGNRLACQTASITRERHENNGIHGIDMLDQILHSRWERTRWVTRHNDCRHNFTRYNHADSESTRDTTGFVPRRVVPEFDT